MYEIDLSYPNILEVISKHIVEDRPPSKAFIIWFLENYYRLDEIDAQDCVCDGIDDLGIDAIYVDDHLERIDIVQSKMYQNNNKAIGDVGLRDLVGAINQFKIPANIDEIAQTTSNKELAGIIIDKKIAQKVSDGYEVFGIFITNVPKHDSADQYIARFPNLIVHDRDNLKARYIPIEPTEPIQEAITFNAHDGHVYYKADEATAVIASVSALELIQMQGIQNQILFSWNVRKSLGNTKINKEIAESIKTQESHSNFLLYHNGLTILCRELNVNGQEITISGYSVVNGCQSLTTLYENSKNITDNLKVLVRIVEVAPDSKLATDITHNSNNQNAIKARDLQSNSVIQRRIKIEFEEQFPDITYTIGRGETVIGQEINNQLVAQILMAFDHKEPWVCHQVSKLFEGDMHNRIFQGPQVTAGRVVVLNEVYNAVESNLHLLDNQLMAGYRLTRFFLLYLVRMALETDELGKQFCENPLEFLDRKEILRTSINAILQDLIIDLNHEIDELAEENNGFDYKRELRNSGAVRQIERKIIAGYEKQVARGRIPSFTEQMANQ